MADGLTNGVEEEGRDLCDDSVSDRPSEDRYSSSLGSDEEGEDLSGIKPGFERQKKRISDASRSRERERASSPRNGKPSSSEGRGVDEDEGGNDGSVSSLLRAGGVEDVSSSDPSEDESDTHGLEGRRGET